MTSPHGTAPFAAAPFDAAPFAAAPLDNEGTLTERLLAARTVLITGELADERATRAAAMLLTLDAEGSDPVRVRLHSTGGDLGTGLMLADTIGAMRAPVHLTAVGEVGGAALAVLAAAARRVAGASTRFHLVEPRPTLPGGDLGRSAGELGRLAETHDALLARLAELLAAATGRSPAEIRADLTPPGRVLGAAEAVAYGLVTEVDGPAR
jgi:ATP-dependent Clp protease protease subunit